MKTTKIILVAAIVMIVASGTSQASGETKKSKQENTGLVCEEEIERNFNLLGTTAFAIPFQLVYGQFIIVEASINGEKLNFLFDENSLQTTLDQEKAYLLGSASQTKLIVGNHPFQEKVVTSDFSRLRASGLNVDGIIGSSIVDSFDVRFDLATNQIICSPF